MSGTWMVTFILVFCILLLCRVCFSLDREVRSQAKAIEALQKAQGMRDGAVVAAITGDLDGELERSATLTEMRRAKRRTLPRENAGPPAKVRKMFFHR